MKTLLTAITILLATWTSSAATVTGDLENDSGSAVQTRITFSSFTSRIEPPQTIVRSRTVLTNAADGSFSVSLAQGNYVVQIASSQVSNFENQFDIYVPGGSGTYDLTDLVGTQASLYQPSVTYADGATTFRTPTNITLSGLTITSNTPYGMTLTATGANSIANNNGTGTNTTLLNPVFVDGQGGAFNTVSNAVGMYWQLKTNYASEIKGFAGLEINTGSPVTLGTNNFDFQSGKAQLVLHGKSDWNFLTPGQDEGGHAGVWHMPIYTNALFAGRVWRASVLSHSGSYKYRLVTGTNEYGISLDEDDAVAGKAGHAIYDFSREGGFEQWGNVPYRRFVETDASSNKKIWNELAEGGNFYWQAVNDAFSASHNFMQATRGTSTNISALTFRADNFNFEAGAITGDGSGLTGVPAAKLDSSVAPDLNYSSAKPVAINLGTIAAAGTATVANTNSAYYASFEGNATVAVDGSFELQQSYTLVITNLSSSPITNAVPTGRWLGIGETDEFTIDANDVAELIGTWSSVGWLYRIPGALVDTGGSATLADGVYGDIEVSGGGTVLTVVGSAITSAKLADGTIVAGDIADNAVTLAKQATGTANRLQGFDAGGAAAEIDPILPLKVTAGQMFYLGETNITVTDVSGTGSTNLAQITIPSGYALTVDRFSGYVFGPTNTAGYHAPSNLIARFPSGGVPAVLINSTAPAYESESSAAMDWSLSTNILTLAANGWAATNTFFAQFNYRLHAIPAAPGSLFESQFNFSEVGMPAGWSVIAGSPSADSTAHTELNGEALGVFTAGDEARLAVASATEKWVTFTFEYAAFPGPTASALSFRDGSDTALAIFRTQPSPGRVALYANGNDTGTTSTTFALTTGDKYYVKLGYLQSGTCVLVVSADTTFATSATDTSTDYYVTKTGGTGSASRLSVRGAGNSTDAWVDDLSVWATDPGATFTGP